MADAALRRRDADAFEIGPEPRDVYHQNPAGARPPGGREEAVQIARSLHGNPLNLDAERPARSVENRESFAGARGTAVRWGGIPRLGKGHASNPGQHLFQDFQRLVVVETSGEASEVPARPRKASSAAKDRS